MLEFHYNGLAIFFTPDQNLRLTSRKPLKKGSKNLKVTNPVPETRREREILMREEDRVKEELLAELELSDPETAERLSLKQFERGQVDDKKLNLRRQINRPGLEPLEEPFVE